MSTNRAVSRAVVAASAAVALVIGGAGIASAHGMRTSTSLYNGSEANSAHTCSALGFTHGNAAIHDARPDGYSVYANYYRQGGSRQRIDNTRGYGTTAHTGCATPGVDRIRGCTERPIIPDVCSDYVS